MRVEVVSTAAQRLLRSLDEAEDRESENDPSYIPPVEDYTLPERRTPDTGEGSVMYQHCGGGRRVIRKRIGN